MFTFHFDEQFDYFNYDLLFRLLFLFDYKKIFYTEKSNIWYNNSINL